MPRLTVALPLYRSARFLPVIYENLDVLTALDDLEILVSDRHGLDDAIDVLRDRYGHDPRFRFFAARDEMDWVTHYQWLLDRGTGTYFVWMPHDDTLPAGHYSGLVEFLDEHPGVLLAFGPIEVVETGDCQLRPLRLVPRRPSWDSPDVWGVREACEMLNEHPWVAFHGAFRRETIARSRLRLRRTYCNEAADTAWLFGAALIGPFRYVPVPSCIKRRYAESTTQRTMPYTLRSVSSSYAVMLAHLVRHGGSARSMFEGVLRLARIYRRKVLLEHLRRRRSAA